MKKYSFLFMCILILSLTGCAGGKEEETPSATVKEESTDEITEITEITEPIEAFDFTVKRTDGTSFTLSEQKGKVILLNFWATWCGPCVYEMPIFEQLYEEYSEEEVIILAVNCMEDEDTVNKFVKESGYTFPIAYDTEGEVGAKYYVSGIPFTLVIDQDGMIRGTFSGVTTIEEQYMKYKDALEFVLKREQE